MSTTTQSPMANVAVAKTGLRRSATVWFGIAAIGQLAFVGFILGYYGRRSVGGDFASWNDKPIIDGYIAGDWLGNAMFIAHALMAAVITLGGLHQLVPALRRRFPLSHRWVGRVFVCTACFMTLSGLWLVWVRGTYLAVASAIPTSINGLLILLCVSKAWLLARRKRYAAHRRWALRAFVQVSGVWFLRVGMMAWVILNQGPRGMNNTLSGPADLALLYGCFLLPLALLELYFFAEDSRRGSLRWLSVGTLAAGSAITAIGVFGTVALMWGPYL